MRRRTARDEHEVLDACSEPSGQCGKYDSSYGMTYEHQRAGRRVGNIIRHRSRGGVDRDCGDVGRAVASARKIDCDRRVAQVLLFTRCQTSNVCPAPCTSTSVGAEGSGTGGLGHAASKLVPSTSASGVSSSNAAIVGVTSECRPDTTVSVLDSLTQHVGEAKRPGMAAGAPEEAGRGRRRRVRDARTRRPGPAKRQSGRHLRCPARMGRRYPAARCGRRSALRFTGSGRITQRVLPFVARCRVIGGRGPRCRRPPGPGDSRGCHLDSAEFQFCPSGTIGTRSAFSAHSCGTSSSVWPVAHR